MGHAAAAAAWMAHMMMRTFDQTSGYSRRPQRFNPPIQPAWTHTAAGPGVSFDIVHLHLRGPGPGRFFFRYTWESWSMDDGIWPIHTASETRPRHAQRRCRLPIQITTIVWHAPFASNAKNINLTFLNDDETSPQHSFQVHTPPH